MHHTNESVYLEIKGLVSHIEKVKGCFKVRFICVMHLFSDIYNPSILRKVRERTYNSR